MGAMRCPDDVVITNPRYVWELNRGDVVLLPICGESKVVQRPFFDPPDKRDVVYVIVSTKAGIMKLSCTRSMSFQYLGYTFDS
jgi:hypothetical protein